MRISIFPSSIALPKSKDEKIKSAKSAIVPEIVEISTDDDLIRVITSYCWSPFVFKGNRKQENFLSTDFAVLDIDEGLTIEEAELIITNANFMSLCVPTTSHTPDNHRFRIIFPLARTITNVEVFKATMEDLREVFPMADASCVGDFARLYFSGTLDDGFFTEGDLLEPVTPPITSKNAPKRSFDPNRRVMVESDIKEIITELYGEERDSIPEVVSHFIKNAHTGLSGEWVTSLNAFVFTLSLQGIDLETIFDLVEFLAPRGELTKRDEDTIERAYKDGEKAREEEI